MDLLQVKSEITSTIFQVGRTLIYLELNTAKHTSSECSRDRPKTKSIQVGDPDQGNLDYLQLRKDTLKVPKQFYLKKELTLKMVNAGYAQNVGEFYKQTMGITDDIRKSNIGGGHPLVPKLRLPKQDHNDEWREILAQAREYDVSSSEPVSSSSES